MKRIILFILTLFLILINTEAQAAQNITRKEIKAVASDGFNIKATLSYPKNSKQKEYSTVVLLHSLGYNSGWWGELPKDLLDKGYAVLAIDLRGHGGSVYNSKLARVSWKSLKNTAYAKYPDDIIQVIKTVKDENTKKTFFNNWAIVGSDIGASAGVIAADKYPVNPKTIVMISPVVKTKGLDIPVNIAHLDKVDFLSVTGTGETASKDSEAYLRKFAQEEFMSFQSESKTSGMLMLKNDPDLPKMIAEWISEYLN